MQRTEKDVKEIMRMCNDMLNNTNFEDLRPLDIKLMYNDIKELLEFLIKLKISDRTNHHREYQELVKSEAAKYLTQLFEDKTES